MPDAEFKRVRDGERARAEDLLFVYNPGAVIQGRYYMAVGNDVIKGVVGLLWRSWYLTELRHLFVKPEFRRQGIGMFLVEEALEKVKCRRYPNRPQS
ncbi:MAG: GNAT family N-acetyltransferase [Nitrospiraceae bacterium]|nr:GNAT family N-acetyltransferase [Nitrospiraceae bacterium]